MNEIVLDEDDNDVEMVDAWDNDVGTSDKHVKATDAKVSQDDDEWPSDLDEDDNLEHNVNDFLHPETTPSIDRDVEEKGKQRAVAEEGGSHASKDRQEIERLNGVAQEQANRLEAQAQQIEAQEREIAELKKANGAISFDAKGLAQQLAEERQHTKRLQEQLLPGPRSRQKAKRAIVQAQRGLGRPACPNRKHARELEKQAERFRNSRAEMDAELAKATAKASEEDRRLQVEIARLQKDLEASQGREKELGEGEMGLFRTTERLEAMLGKRDGDCKELSLQAKELTRAKEAAEARAESLRLANRILQAEEKDPEAGVDGRLEALEKPEESAREGPEGEREMDALLGPLYPGWKKWVVSLSVGFLFGLVVASSAATGSS